MNKRPPSNIRLLEQEYRMLITDIRDGDGSGLLSSRSCQRYTFLLSNGSRLRITERISGEYIDYSYYDWELADGRVIKFHSEPHNDDSRYQTVTEPHHIHPPDEDRLHNIVRYPNFHHQELSAIIEMIFITIIQEGHTP